MKLIEFDRLILQNILHHIDAGIHVIDKFGRTVYYNDAMAHIEGIEKDKVIDKHILEIFPSLDEETSTLLTVMNTGERILNRTQIYLNYKGEKITTINTTIPLIHEDVRYGALEIAENVTNIKNLSEQLVNLQEELAGKHNDSTRYKGHKYIFSDIIGNSEGLRKAINIAKRATDSSSSVLIYGETGSGKELFAQSIHYDGKRKNKPFIGQNCAALPESLLESILFGTVKGSFTGAIDKPGLFEHANGGTLLLDEINSMGLSLQAKLLRVLQEGYIRRVGGLKDIPIDVRIIATTNQDPLEAIMNGMIRKDLYYRLNVVSITVPPLRERKEDIEILTDFFIKLYNDRIGKDAWRISQDVLDVFNKYSWPGNVRELENFIEGAMNYISNDEHILKREHFPSHIFNVKDKQIDINNILQSENSLSGIIINIEKNLIIRMLYEEDGNISRAAKKLNIKRQTLQHKMKKYNISS